MSLADVLVAIDPAAERPLAVVHVEDLDARQADELLKRLKRLLVFRLWRQRVPGREGGARVEPAGGGARKSW